MSDLIVDNFACGGGASEGIETALGRPVEIAINHNAKALAVHQANHPRTLHLREDIRDLDPRRVAPERQVELAWFSPDCVYHSKARGGKPFRDRKRTRRVRGLAWSGETFVLGSTPIWVRDVAVAIAIARRKEEIA